MATLGELKALVDLGNQQVSEGQAASAASKDKLTDIVNAAQNVANDARNMFGQASEKFGEAQQS